jgi:hypothetical protein
MRRQNEIRNHETLRLESGIHAHQPGNTLRDQPALASSAIDRANSAVGVALAAIALVSAWIPARRATRVRPADALRSEA